MIKTHLESEAIAMTKLTCCQKLLSTGSLHCSGQDMQILWNWKILEFYLNLTQHVISCSDGTDFMRKATLVRCAQNTA